MGTLASKFPIPLGGIANDGKPHGVFLYDSLILPIRQADSLVGNEILKRFLDGIQWDFERTGENILLLMEQVSPSTIGEELVKYLKDIVGFTAELRNITDRLAVDDLRRLIQTASSLWKERHTATGLSNAIRFLTGKTSTYFDWFSYRFILGENLIGEEQLQLGGDSWIIGGETSRYDEHWSNLKLMDDGNLDEQLLLEIVRLERPVGERIEVFLLDFLDRFDAELNLWDVISGSPVVVGGELEMTDSAIEPVIPIVSSPNQKEYAVVTKFRLDSVTNANLEVRWYWDSVANNDYYYMLIRPDNPTEVEVWAYSTGSFPLILKDVTEFSLIRDVDYKLRFQTFKDPSGDNVISVWIDNNLIGTITDTTFSGFITDGTFRFISTGKVWLDNVESWRDPARFATVELSTLTERGGAITKTVNFIQ